MEDISRCRESFWVESTPETIRPYWHEGDCYMEITWDFTQQRPKTTSYGTTGSATLCKVIVGDEHEVLLITCTAFP